jgi:16S rRNA (cytosine967-C5)-methyltransferase
VAAAARATAYAVVRRVFEQGAYADRALHAEADAAGLDPRDRALATQLAYGTVQRARTLDHLLQPLASRPLEKLDPPVLAALRLGAFQLAFTDGIPDHAAVNDSVELVKLTSRGGAQLVNAVLRRAAREIPAALQDLTDETPQQAAILHSVPDWIAELWWEELGAEEARALLRTINEPAESALRINTLNAPADLRLPVPNHPAPELPEGRILDAPFDAFGSAAWRAGQIMPQSRASMLVSRMLDPQPGERVLDLCAAPGAKTTHLAALMGGEGEIVAVEANPGRARQLARTCARMHVEIVETHPVDGRALPAMTPFDRVLVDPPCSGLGTLRSRPDLRWQPHRRDTGQTIVKQGELLRAGAARLKAGGTLVYSTCTIARAENEDVVTHFLSGHPEFTREQERRVLPHRDGTDGFYIARLRRIR